MLLDEELVRLFGTTGDLSGSSSAKLGRFLHWVASLVFLASNPYLRKNHVFVDIFNHESLIVF